MLTLLEQYSAKQLKNAWLAVSIENGEKHRNNVLPKDIHIHFLTMHWCMYETVLERERKQRVDGFSFTWSVL